MRLQGKASWLASAVVLVLGVALAGCENPLDPVDKTDEIRGLTYVDFSVTWERWDSDPLFDGVVVKPEYFNEFGDSLAFHDKSHTVNLEFYTQNEETVNDVKKMVRANLFYSTAVPYEDADDSIRIPIEAYQGAMFGAGYDRQAEGKAFVVMRVNPPKSIPKAELVVGYPDITIFKPEESDITPNGAPFRR